MLLLYDQAPSSNALKVRFLLAELGLDYETETVTFDRPRPLEYTAWHPYGTIPGLRDGEYLLGESNAILRYLARRERRGDLYPDDPQGQGRVDWALDAWATQVRPKATPLERATIMAEPPDEAAIERALPEYVEALDAYERLAGGEGFVVGSGLTIADCCVMPGLWRTERMPVPEERWPKLMRIRENLARHPAWIAAGPVRKLIDATRSSLRGVSWCVWGARRGRRSYWR